MSSQEVNRVFKNIQARGGSSAAAIHVSIQLQRLERDFPTLLYGFAAHAANEGYHVDIDSILQREEQTALI